MSGLLLRDSWNVLSQPLLSAGDPNNLVFPYGDLRPGPTLEWVHFIFTSFMRTLESQMPRRKLCSLALVGRTQRVPMHAIAIMEWALTVVIFKFRGKGLNTMSLSFPTLLALPPLPPPRSTPQRPHTLF